jgi:hypothetical protein
MFLTEPPLSAASHALQFFKQHRCVAIVCSKLLTYGGRYGRAVWSEANYRGQMFRDEVAYRLRSIYR